MRAIIAILILLPFLSRAQRKPDTLEYENQRLPVLFDSVATFSNGFMIDTNFIPPSSFNQSVDYITLDGSNRETEGVYRLVLKSAGGGSALVDSTRIEQDSIAVYYQNGAEIGRDTIRLGTAGQILTEGFLITIQGDSINVDSIPASYVTDLKDSILANQIEDRDWLFNGTSLYTDTLDNVVVNNDTTANGARFEVWKDVGGLGVNYNLNLLQDTSQVLEKTLNLSGEGNIDTIYKYNWNFGVGDTTYNNKWANNGSPLIYMPATSFSAFDARATIINIKQPVAAYSFQVSDFIPFQYLPSSFGLIGSNDTLMGWDTLSYISGLDTSSYNYNGVVDTDIDSIKVYETDIQNTYIYHRFFIDSLVQNFTNFIAPTSDGGQASIVDLKLFPQGGSVAFQVFGNGIIKISDAPYKSTVDTLLAYRNDTVVSTVVTTFSEGDNISILGDSINLDSVVKVRSSSRNKVIFDTLTTTGNDTIVNLNFENSQGLYVYCSDTSVKGILFDLDTNTIEVGFIQDFSVTLEVDTLVSPPTLYFQSGEFQLLGGEAPTLTEDNSDSTRKDVITFRYDGATLRAKVLIAKDFRNN